MARPCRLPGAHQPQKSWVWPPSRKTRFSRGRHTPSCPALAPSFLDIWAVDDRFAFRCGVPPPRCCQPSPWSPCTPTPPPILQAPHHARVFTRVIHVPHAGANVMTPRKRRCGRCVAAVAAIWAGCGTNPHPIPPRYAPPSAVAATPAPLSRFTHACGGYGCAARAPAHPSDHQLQLVGGHPQAATACSPPHPRRRCSATSTL